MLTIGACYAHPWIAYLLCGVLIVASVGYLRNARRVSAFFIENFTGPWRVDPAVKTRSRESINTWTSMATWLSAVFAVAAILIAIGAAVQTATCN